MIFDAESKHVRWNMSTLQRKVYPKRNPQEGAPQRLFLRIPQVAETAGIGRTIISELIATGVVPTIRVGRAVRIPDIALQKEDQQFRNVVLRRLHW
jgi:excisionase family DNA binding protein